MMVRRLRRDQTVFRQLQSEGAEIQEEEGMEATDQIVLKTAGLPVDMRASLQVKSTMVANLI
jgi:hypothetical protein